MKILRQWDCIHKNPKVIKKCTYTFKHITSWQYFYLFKSNFVLNQCIRHYNSNMYIIFQTAFVNTFYQQNVNITLKSFNCWFNKIHIENMTKHRPSRHLASKVLHYKLDFLLLTTLICKSSFKFTNYSLKLVLNLFLCFIYWINLKK